MSKRFSTESTEPVSARNEKDRSNTDEDRSRRDEITDERIALRAYERYLARGGEDGGDVDDWLEAERELREQVDRER